MSPPTHIYVAVWPITTTAPDYPALVREARRDLTGHLLPMARARLTGKGRFTIRRSVDVPGSGCLTEWCLHYAVPAEATHRTRRNAA